MRVLTWHVHGSYLWYLTHGPHDFFLPVREGRPEGYGGRTSSFPWGDNVHEVTSDDVADLDVDVVLYQSHRNWTLDRYEILSDRQRRGPSVVLEHDPPRQSPTDARHPVDDPDVLLVHCTAFNDLMWDSGATPTTVVDHGVVVPDGVRWTGEVERGVVVVNGLASRGRRLGADLVARAAVEVPLEIVGMGAEQAGGRGEVPPGELAAFVARHRFFFHPIRWTSLGLAVLEAMMLGVPVVAVASTELVTVVTNGVSGIVDTRVDRLIGSMHQLLADPERASALGAAGRRVAEDRFGIERFVADWTHVFERVADRTRMGP